MPCCAFAAFILGQILIGLDAIKRFVFRRTSLEQPDNPATEWRLATAHVPPAARRGVFRAGSIRWLAVATLLELVLAIGSFCGLRAHLHHHHHDASPVAGAATSSVSAAR